MSDFHVDKVTLWGVGNFYFLRCLCWWQGKLTVWMWGSVGRNQHGQRRRLEMCLHAGPAWRERQPFLGKVSSELSWIGKNPHLTDPQTSSLSLQKVATKFTSTCPTGGRCGLQTPGWTSSPWRVLRRPIVTPKSACKLVAGLWLVRSTTSSKESTVLGLWQEEETIFLQNPIQVSCTSWDKNGGCLLSSWRKTWARFEVTKSLANTRRSGAVSQLVWYKQWHRFHHCVLQKNTLQRSVWITANSQ